MYLYKTYSVNLFTERGLPFDPSKWIVLHIIVAVQSVTDATTDGRVYDFVSYLTPDSIFEQPTWICLIYHDADTIFIPFSSLRSEKEFGDPPR